MSRLWISILTLFIYALAQFGVAILQATGAYGDLQGQDLAIAGIYTQVTLFIIAAIFIILLHLFTKNPTQLEQQPKEEKRYIVLWAIVGYIAVMIYQIIANMINIYIFHLPQESENTTQLMEIAQQIPIFIVLISIVGPILEEYVFRKVIFGELYNVIKGNRVVAFIIATTVSSLIFGLAHGDPTHMLIYFGMGVIFSGFYVLTKRLWVSILIHMFQNGFVVIMQFALGPDKIKELQDQVDFILQFLF